MPDTDIAARLNALERTLESAPGLTCDASLVLFEVRAFLESLSLRLERGLITPDSARREAERLAERLCSAQDGLELTSPLAPARSPALA